MSSTTKSQEAFLLSELEQVKKDVPLIDDVKLIAAVQLLVRAEIKKTDHKQVAVTCMFQPNYPDVPLVTEIRSKTLADKLLDGLGKLCDAEALKLKGQQQAVHIIHFVNTFLDENPLCVCSEEIAKAKKLLTADNDEIKLKQKQSHIILKVNQDDYFVHMKITVPDVYPHKQVVPEVIDHNFPEFLRVNFQAQAVEIARQCVIPPLRKKPKDPPFTPKPSLEPVCSYVIQCVKRYPTESCPICQERVLPADPTSEKSTKGKHRVEKVYCGHLFHFICLNKLLKTPPYSAGKMCPSCGKQIFHEKFKTSAEVLEQRWAHKQAKARELEEVQDFLS